MRKPVGGEALDPVLTGAIERTAHLLESLGHQVEEASPDYDAALLDAAFWLVMCANTWTNIQVRAAGRVPGQDDLEPVTRIYAERGRTVSAEQYIRAVQAFHRTGRQLGAFLDRYDVLLSTTIARNPTGEPGFTSAAMVRASIRPGVSLVSHRVSWRQNVRNDRSSTATSAPIFQSQSSCTVSATASPRPNRW